MSSLYDRLCASSYRLLRRILMPGLLNSQYSYRDELRQALSRSDGVWLDLGCGHDFLPPWLAADERRLKTSAWTIIGLDADESALKRHAGLRHRVLATGERLPFRDGSVTLITANMVVEHVQHPKALFDELGRVLADGGRAIIHTPNRTGYTTALTHAIPSGLLKPFAAILLNRAGEDVYPTYYRANTHAALAACAADAGLTMADFAFVDSSPQFYRVPPLMAVELVLMRLLRVRRLSRLRPCLIAILEKPRRGTAGD
jgi:ubiquinone/menaquinone biosynthesis C-methylase UbiE